MSSTEIIIMFISCVPSAIVGLGVWLLQRKFNQSEKRREEREKAREKNEPKLFTPVPDNRLNTRKTLIKMKNRLSPKR